MKSLAQIRADNAPPRRSAPTAVRVHCNACSGTGQRKLTAVELETLICIGRTWTPMSDIRSMLGDVERTALSNRLAHIAGYGLVERRRVGRNVEWRRL